jgi:hypothetical protein
VELEQRLEHPADLTAGGRAEGDLGAQQGDHPGLPDALPTRVHVQLGQVVLPLERHRQLGRRHEHHDAFVAHGLSLADEHPPRA